MNNKKQMDISAYFIVGPENTKSRPVAPIIREAIKGGFTFIQIRSKTASAKDLIELTVEASEVIKNLGKENEVSLVVNDRLDVILAAREAGAKVDGIHVGQTDIPVDICRKYLGEDAIIGLSAKTEDLIDYIKSADITNIDYFGAGPLHETSTKKDCGLTSDGKIITKSIDEIKELAKISPIPVVIGGGVKLDDIADLAKTGINGFFLVSAVSEAENPKLAAENLVKIWKENI